MSLASLEAALENAAAQINPILPQYSSLFEEDGATPKQILPHWITGPIQKEIEQTPELKAFACQWIRTPSSGQRLTDWNVAMALIFRLFTGARPKEIISDILDLARKHECLTCTYVGLYGGGIATEIKLDESVRVLPANASPPSFAREYIFGIDRHDRPLHEFGRIPRWHPNLALLIYEETKIFGDGNEIDSVQLRSISEKVDRSIRALTLASGFAFVRNWQTSWIVHPAIPYEGFGGYGGSGSFEPFPQGTLSADRLPVDPAVARAIYLQLADLTADLQRPLGLAADRLRRSRIHPPSADTAIDLGISGEIVLLHNINSTAELGYRFAVNGAYLLGRDGGERAKYFEALRALYDARSKAVHRGTLDPKILSRLPEFDLLCAQIIKCILAQKKFPDWKQLVLGEE